MACMQVFMEAGDLLVSTETLAELCAHLHAAAAFFCMRCLLQLDANLPVEAAYHPLCRLASETSSGSCVQEIVTESKGFVACAY